RKTHVSTNNHRHGTVAQPPITHAEVQGYVYDAKYPMASLMRAFGDVSTADRLKRDAAELARRFEKSFWRQGIGYYAMALDAQKKPLDVIASNAGHLLFTRLIPRERMRAATARLLQPDMLSGWGCRSLSQQDRVLNPLSDQRRA